MDLFDKQNEQMAHKAGFVAALDQSGGSTPKTLQAYGIGEDAYANEQAMFDKVHEMRERIITSRVFDGERILAAILFEQTMRREIMGTPTPKYLWETKGIIPIVKVDKGLESENAGVQLMKPMLGLERLLDEAKERGVYGTKMRSVIHQANAASIEAVVEQQFEYAKKIWERGLVPIVEPEVSIRCPNKLDAEQLLRSAIEAQISNLEPKIRIALKLTLPEEPNFYRKFVENPRVVRVVALSGGYSREDANEKLAKNSGVIASFSRALIEDLRVDQSDEAFTVALDAAIESIFRASIA